MSGMFRACQWLRELTISAESVPEMAEDAFNNKGEEGPDFSKMTLHVPENLISEYLKTSPWKSFGTILAFKPTGIQAVHIDNGDSTIYNLQGHRQDSMRKGINIIRQPDGQTIKVIKK